MRPLTDKQKRFITEYLVDQNGTQAAIRAGYAPKAANRQAVENLSKPVIRAEIDRRLASLSEDAGVTVKRVVEELALLAFSDIGDILDFTGDKPKLKRAKDISQVARRTIASVKVTRHVEGTGDDAHTVEVTEFKLWSKPEALDKLARKLRIYQDPLQAVKTLLGLLPYELGIRVWAGITGGAAALGSAETARPGAAGGAAAAGTQV